MAKSAPYLSPISASKSPILQIAVKQCMIQYAIQIMTLEEPILSPDLGYKAYDKRMALAKLVVQNPDMYVEMASRLVATIYPLVETLEELDSYLTTGNGTGNFMSLKVIYSGSPTEPSLEVGLIGFQLWDALAGVIASDLAEPK